MSEREGMLRRQCTKEFKIVPIERKTRELLGVAKGARVPKGVNVESWHGITLDEIQRCKESRTKWITNRWPLIEKRMSRWDCIRWIEEHGFRQPSRSACVYCPYRSNKEWRAMRDEDPQAWEEACRVDDLIRGGVRGPKDPLYVHQSLKPLKEVDLSTDEDQGQMTFLGECDGMCGV